MSSSESGIEDIPSTVEFQKLKFKCGMQQVLLEYYRKTKQLYITSSKTGYIRTKTVWKNLFDPGKERVQENITDKLNDEEFRLTIIAAFNKLGYEYVEE